MISSLYTVPEGLAFQPRDKVLLSHYLTKKNQGKDAQITIIPVIDVSKHEPRDLPGNQARLYVLLSSTIIPNSMYVVDGSNLH